MSGDLTPGELAFLQSAFDLVLLRRGPLPGQRPWADRPGGGGLPAGHRVGRGSVCGRRRPRPRAHVCSGIARFFDLPEMRALLEPPSSGTQQVTACTPCAGNEPPDQRLPDPVAAAHAICGQSRASVAALPAARTSAPTAAVVQPSADRLTAPPWGVGDEAARLGREPPPRTRECGDSDHDERQH